MMKVPPKLYKYKSLSGGSFEYAMDTIMNNRIYMTEIKKLNDPFEGVNKYNLSIKLPDSNKNHPFELADTFSDLCGVYSLSEHPDIPQMWVHYADNFKGICIEFSTHSTFSAAEKMNYDDNVISCEDIDSMDNVDNGALDEYYISSLLRKGKNWEYEKEWRLISLGCLRNRYIQLEEAEITAVILGTNVSPCIKKLLWLWRDTRKDMVIKECYFEEKSYKIEIY